MHRCWFVNPTKKRYTQMLQKKFHKISLTALAMMTAMAFSSASSAALVNASFEDTDASGGDVAGAAGWFSFNNSYSSSNLFGPPVFFVNPTAHSGTQVLKQYGTDGGSGQGGVAASAGDIVSASVYAQNWTGDAFNNLALLQIAYLDTGGGVIGVDEIFADSIGNQAYLLLPQVGDAVADWTLMELSGTAPTGTASAQILLLHILTAGTPDGGSIFWDDASLEVSAIPVPAAVWLFGSGLLGLVGVARRRKA
ncbi:MAG: VPLPA-CTERM sorting domain-containing protein [Gammaproteobacteria bacterium]|nr:VPLPA-CTERM sorting domain-containing protein [Gammaproteobacteria bacterium]